MRTAFVAILFFAALSVRAQPFAADSSDTGTPSKTALSFDRSINTFRWDLLGKYSADFLGWHTSLSDHFLRNLIISDRENVKDENSFLWTLRRGLLPNLSAQATVTSFVFSDQRSLGLNDVASNAFSGGFRWLPLDNVRLLSSAGIVFDRQQGIVDNGILLEADGMLRDLRFGDSRLDGELFLKNEYIAPRYQQEQRVGAVLRNELAEGSMHSLQLTYRDIRRDYYLPPDSAITALFGIANPISSRDERILSITDHLDYEIVRSLALRASFDLSQRAIRNTQPYRNVQAASPQFDSEIREFRMTGNVLLHFDNDAGTNGDIRFEMNEREETHAIDGFAGMDQISFTRQKHVEEQKNNTIYQNQLSLSLAQSVGTRDTVSFAGSTVKLEYDTPDSNPDDRDELFMVASLRWAHRFNEHLLSSVTGDASARHIVYIYSERSANNTWNRVFRIAPSVAVRYPGVVSITAAEVIGNYTVYDFEAISPDLQSFSLRLLTLCDSLELRLTGAYTLAASLMLRYYEQGELHWDRFTERPTAFYEERTAAVAVQRGVERWIVAAGIRYFQQQRFRYPSDVKTRDNVLTSFGPTARLVFPTIAETGVSVEGWYQLTSENGQSLRKTPNITVSMVWRI